MFNVYTHYDDTKTVIARIRPFKDASGHFCITDRTYKQLLKKRTVGGEAGIYTDCPERILVMGPFGIIDEI